MIYRVIRQFCDMQDGYHVYNVGDKFPYVDKPVSESRIAQLKSENNACGQPVIEPMIVKAESSNVQNVQRRGRKPKQKSE